MLGAEARMSTHTRTWRVPEHISFMWTVHCAKRRACHHTKQPIITGLGQGTMIVQGSFWLLACQVIKPITFSNRTGFPGEINSSKRKKRKKKKKKEKNSTILENCKYCSWLQNICRESYIWKSWILSSFVQERFSSYLLFFPHQAIHSETPKKNIKNEIWFHMMSLEV